MVSWEDISYTQKERAGGEILSLSLYLSLSFILLCYTHFVTHTQLMMDVFSMVSWVEMGFRDKKTDLVVVGSFFFVPPPKMNLSMVAEIQECHPPAYDEQGGNTLSSSPMSTM